MESIQGCSGWGLLLALYLAPTIVAQYRSHPQFAPILVVNVQTGWTGVGWVVAIAWALTTQPQHQAAK
jgi:hypothetical protein